MILTERHIIKNTNGAYATLDNLCFLSKNLYNSALYAVRQHFFETKKYLSYFKLQKQFQNNNNHDYRALPAKISQQTLKLVEFNFKSFFSLLKRKDIKNKIPKYLDTLNGRQIVTYTNQAISQKELKNGFIKLSGVDNFKLKTNVENVQQVRIIPKSNHVIIEVLYKTHCIGLKNDNFRYASIDIGLNNLATIASNVANPIIINGKPVKSINQFFNKTKSYLQSLLPVKQFNSKAIDKLTFKRNNKINDYIHKSSRYIVNHLVSNDINTLIIGKNKQWKQDINIGKRNNQNFVCVPHNKLINQLKYKCQLLGINVIIQEESYTSKCSFLDNEDVKKHDVYKGKRVKRGMFRSNDGTLINADVNGALNILKKAVGKFDYDPIEVCSAPRIVSL